MKNDLQANIDILRHMLKYCNNIELIINRFGNSFDVFKDDIAFRDAISMNILQIGELTGKLTEEYKNTNRNRLPWSAMKQMRNFFAHNYGNMDLKIIWQTAIDNIPEVKAFCEEQIRSNMAFQENVIDCEDIDDENFEF